MSCPHGVNSDPRTCSQCLQAAGLLLVRVRVCARDEATGALLLDGEPVKRLYMPPSTGHAPLKTKTGGRPPRRAADTDEDEGDAN